MRAYKGSNICVITPTKDRPEKVKHLLGTLANQTEKVGRVIVVGSGLDISKIVLSFSRRLPVEYYHSSQSGQIIQRNLGITKLNAQTKLVATIDDDILLAPDAVERVINFWNHAPKNTAGVGFNITNFPRHRPSRLRRLFFASEKRPGRVLSSGFVTQITNVKEDIQTEWLNGGATTWKQDLIINNRHMTEIRAAWSPCEDLLFSYPVSKKHALFVCASAKVLHDDIPAANLRFRQHFYRGKTLSIWLIYFVNENPGLSTYRCALAITILSAGGFMYDLCLGRFRRTGFHFGRIAGLFRALRQVCFKGNIISAIK